MTPGLTSIIIAHRDMRATLPDAIRSALAQTAPVEVIVVDDASNEPPADALRDLIAGHANLILLALKAQGGPGTARNKGLELAAGEFVQFLDADDTLDSHKLARQLAEMDADVGFVICDTRIIEASGKQQLASERYGYERIGLDGWIAGLLAVKNVLPVHAPLYRRSAIGDIRFPGRDLEDWHFVHAVAKVARCRYLPKVLCTYRKRAGSRNSTTRRDVTTAPGFVPPLRLNLGCGSPGTLSWHPIPGMVNLDKSLGWRFEDGLPDFADGSVAAITVSHALMYVAIAEWPRVFGEFARVLEPGGVLRITEDDTTNPASSLYGGWKGSEPAVTLTDAAMTRRHMEAVGLSVRDVTADATFHRDASLIQAQHRPAPACYWIEGIRECAVLFEPHADDGPLFSAMNMIRHRPQVITVFESAGDYGDTETRHQESVAAATILGAGPVEQWDGRDLIARMRALDGQIRPTRVFAPGPDTSHPDHACVATAARIVFGERLTSYQTYNALGKVRDGDPVPFEAGWAERKRQALACYATQRAHPRAAAFFDETQFGLDEWTA